MDASSLWEDLRLLAGRPDEGRTGLWAWLQERLDLAMVRPQAVPGVIASQLDGRDGLYTVIKNPATKTYYRLSERDTFLWELMDGTRTVKDLVVAYFGRYGSFAFGRVAGLVTGLRANGFLTDKPVDVYRQVHEKLEGRRLRVRLGRFWHAFLQTPLAISGLDGALDRVYKGVGWLLFTRPAQVLYVALSLLGVILYGRLFISGTYSLVSEAGSYGLGLVILIVAQFVAVFLHELAHALTVKHYRREVRRAGIMIYFGMPAFFVDTTDMWLEGKRARLAVTWAGPYSGLILAGLVTLAMVAWPALPLNPLLFKFAFTCYILVFINLNPLLELDGYYLLMDWLQISQLRRKSMEFLRAGLPAKMGALRLRLAARPPRTAMLTADERIFLVFGLLAVAWTIYAVWAGLVFWQTRLVQGVRSVWEGGTGPGRWALRVLGITISVLFVAVLAAIPYRLAWGWAVTLRRRGLFRSLWRVLALLLLTSTLLVVLPALLGYPIIVRLAGVAALIAASWFGWKNARSYAGSRFSATYTVWAASAIALALVELIGLAPIAGMWPYVQTTLGLMGTAGLLSGAGLLFASANLREAGTAEKAAIGIGAAAGYYLFVVFVQGGWLGDDPAAYLALNAVVLPWLAATLLIPVLAAFWGTRAAAAWSAVTAALVGLALFSLVRLPPAFPYLVLASGFYLHHLAYIRAAGISPAENRQVRNGGDLAPRSDARRLQQAFAATAGVVHAHLIEIAGRRSAAAVAGQFNGYALAAGWRVSLGMGQIQDTLPADLPIVRRGESYAAALSTLLDLAAAEIGEPLTVAALRRAFDALPWEAREIGAQYLFRQMPRAAALSSAFSATSRDVTHLLRGMPLLATMNHDELAALAARLTPLRYAAGEAIIRQGDAGDRFYIVHQGHVEVRQANERGISTVVNQLGRGGYFGEMALLRDVPRTATCVATIPTTLFCLSREDFERTVKDRFAMRDKLDRSVARAELLRRIPLFAEMDGSQVQHIAALMREEGYLAGAYLMRQGEPGETFYVIQSGQVEVLLERAGETIAVAQRGPGEYLGEIALLLSVPRTASVRALTHVRTLALDKIDFDRLVADQLAVAQGLARESSRRMLDLGS